MKMERAYGDAYIAVGRTETGTEAPKRENVINNTHENENALKRPKNASMSVGEMDAYRDIYKAVYNFHQRHTPPPVDTEYWAEHEPKTVKPPPADIQYWESVGDDLDATAKQCGGGELITDMLIGVIDELERVYMDAIAKAYTRAHSKEDEGVA